MIALTMGVLGYSQYRYRTKSEHDMPVKKEETHIMGRVETTVVLGEKEHIWSPLISLLSLIFVD